MVTLQQTLTINNCFVGQSSQSRTKLVLLQGLLCAHSVQGTENTLTVELVSKWLTHHLTPGDTLVTRIQILEEEMTIFTYVPVVLS